MKYWLLVILFGNSLVVHSQRKIDVLLYDYHLTLSDRSDSVSGWASIKFVALENIPEVSFDLASINSPKKTGMEVGWVIYRGHSAIKVRHTHDQDKLTIHKQYKKADTGNLTIFYRGIPADGLIISRNKFGHRTFFSDNWPDRAHKWIPCVDDPADKAAVHFTITAPAHYEVISNGIMTGEKLLENNKKETRWKEDVPLPTKIMVIGVADFAVDTSGYVNNIPVTSWVFPEDKKKGFYDYEIVKDMLAYFINYIGPYPYKKLANVQSKTIFGGMENAGAIFYNENSIDGKRSDESTMAHEVAHQWFGDMATEKNFSHLWLSEGFATYMSHMYLESKYGPERLKEEMWEDREQVIGFIKTSQLPVVDSATPYMQLLNANSYQKGGWVLHMLRRQLGDSVFHQIIKTYYAAYAGKNADTRDFQKICEQVSGKDLTRFFDQWLYTPGCPQLDVKWEYQEGKKEVLVTITQLQNTAFEFPLDILLQSGKNKDVQPVWITKQVEQINIPVNEKVDKLVLDPLISLLFEDLSRK